MNNQIFLFAQCILSLQITFWYNLTRIIVDLLLTRKLTILCPRCKTHITKTEYFTGFIRILGEYREVAEVACHELVGSIACDID